MNLLLYIACVFIWGTTWTSIRWQIGEVPLEISVVYRFLIGSSALFLVCFLTKKNLKFSAKHHFGFFLLGSCLFGLNYIFAYQAVLYLTTGLAAVLFSTFVIANIFNQALFFKKKVELLVLIGAVIGVTGVMITFSADLIKFDLTSLTMVGIGYMLACSYSASLGNMVSTKLSQLSIPVLQSTAYAMLYGAIFVTIYSQLQGQSFVFDTSFSYIASLLYLALAGSSLCFVLYLELSKRIGPDKSAYALVLVPIVALFLSMIFENFRWNLETGLGVTLTILGNILILSKKKTIMKS